MEDPPLCCHNAPATLPVCITPREWACHHSRFIITTTWLVEVYIIIMHVKPTQSKAVPHAKLHFHGANISAVASPFFVLCMERAVDPQVDTLSREFLVNDGLDQMVYNNAVTMAAGEAGAELGLGLPLQACLCGHECEQKWEFRFEARLLASLRVAVGFGKVVRKHVRQ